MKFVLHLILYIISICKANNNFLCQSVDGRTKSIEKYCEPFIGMVPEYCINEELNRIEPDHVKRLTIGGCDKEMVLNNIKHFKNVRILDISQSVYQTINWLDIKLKHLQKFNASFNEISYVLQLVKNSTPEITELDLSHNQLMNIGSDTFGKIDKLVKLYLSHNRLDYISFDAFLGAFNLEYMDLGGNRLREVPLLFDNSNLKTIHLEDNPICHFNYCFISLVHNASVYFSWASVKNIWRGNSCNRIPFEPLPAVVNSNREGILYSTNGKYEIHLNEQSFQNLDSFTAGRKSYANVMDLVYNFGSTMMHMDLSGNFIGQLNTNILRKFDRLSILCVSDTMLTEFDLSTVNTRLTKLDISSNKLKTIGNAPLLETFTALTTLNISNNQFENVLEFIHYMSSSIERLDLSGNFVGRLNQYTFERLPSLKVLNLKQTFLSISDCSPFKPLEHLNQLDVSHNNLKNVDFSTLSQLKMLNDFRAAHCQIDNISRITQHLGSSLRKLDLSGNFVVTFNADILSTLTNLECLNLSNSNMFTFDYQSAQHQIGLRDLDLSFNHLKTLNLAYLPTYLQRLNLQQNDLTEITNFDRNVFTQFKSLAISQNQLSCQFLRDFLSQWHGIEIDGDPINQKHAADCRSSTQGVQDFLNSVYDLVKFW